MFLRLFCIVAALAISAPGGPSSAMAQEQSSQDTREVYRIDLLEFRGEEGPRWVDAMRTIIIPARKEAGLPVPVIHQLVAGEYEVMVVTLMPEGFAALDRTSDPSRAALTQALIRQVGSREALVALGEELSGLITQSSVTYSYIAP